MPFLVRFLDIFLPTLKIDNSSAHIFVHRSSQCAATTKLAFLFFFLLVLCYFIAAPTTVTYLQHTNKLKNNEKLFF